MEVALAGVIFLITYALIATDRVDKTVAALLGGSLVVILGIVDQEEAFAAIDLNVIFLLAGMMILAGNPATDGLLPVGGDPLGQAALAASRIRLLLVLCVVTAVAVGAFLDNVTTVVLLAPVTLYIAGVAAAYRPLPFLISADPGLQHRWDGDAHRRPAEHPDRLRRRPRLRSTFLVNMAPAAALVILAVISGHARTGSSDVPSRRRRPTSAIRCPRLSTSARS